MPSANEPNRDQAAILELSHVSRLFGSFVALRDLSLQIPAGSSVLVLGPNGAGKSTLLRLLAGLQQPSYGTVHIFGHTPQQMRGRMAYMGHQTTLYDELTGAENLHYLLSLERPRLTAAQLWSEVEQAMAQVGLDPANPRKVGEYSQGMRQRASLARVLLPGPDVLLLDEPFSNLDVRSAHAMVERLKQYMAEPGSQGLPRTLLVTTHQAHLARPLAKRVITLENGQLADQVATDAAQAVLAVEAR